MREILFRGKGIDNNWYYGVPLVFTEDCVCMFSLYINSKKVEANTVGQYTGLTDKNGKKIFDGDIVKVYEDIDYRIGVHKTNRKTRTIIGVVVFDEKRFEYKIKNEEYDLTLFRLSKKDTNEVIGNIHDNPELLKGGAADE